MSRTIDELVSDHLVAWNLDGGPDRARTIAAVYTEDVVVHEPGTALNGRVGVQKAIAGLQQHAPGCSLSRTSPVQTVGDLSTYTWDLAPAGGEAVASGRDVLIVRDGLVAGLYVLIDDA